MTSSRACSATLLAAVVLTGCGRPDGETRTLADLVPRGARVIDAQAIEAAGDEHRQMLVTWTADADRGLILYDVLGGRVRYRPVFTIGPGPSTVNGFYDRAELAAGRVDLDGDGHDELLAVEGSDGSAGDAAFHIVASTNGHTRDVARFQLSVDDGSVVVAPQRLTVVRGFDHDPADHGPHCCWRRWRRTVSTLRHGRLVTLATTTSRRDLRARLRNFPLGP